MLDAFGSRFERQPTTCPSCSHERTRTLFNSVGRKMGGCCHNGLPLLSNLNERSIDIISRMGSVPEPAYLYKNVVHDPAVPSVQSAKGMYIHLDNGQIILDATCGAAVSAIGHGVERVKQAMISQLDQVEYSHPGFFPNAPAMRLADMLVESTDGKMSRACILGSGNVLPQYSLRKNSFGARLTTWVP
jgi:hypothetical protein